MALLTRLKKYNLSVIESGFQDKHDQIELQMVLIRANESMLNRELVNLQAKIASEFPNLDLYILEKEIYI